MFDTTDETMKAAVLHTPGGPDALHVEQLPVPAPAAGRVLIRVKAFGINRSELFTRRGESPGVSFPRVLGIEAVGLVEAAPGGAFAKGDTVATAMGGMGRDYDGGYAEYVSVPSSQVRALRTELPWETLGSLPEMLQTSWGSLYTALDLQRGDRLLVRGGTTSIGLAAAAIASKRGAIVASTSRSPDREQLLRDHGASEVFIDDGSLHERVRASGGADKVLELIGTTTLLDSLRCANERGVVCMTGIVGNAWAFDRFAPMEAIPSTVRLTSYDGGPADFMKMPMQELVDDVAAGRLAIQIGRVFHLDEIAEAHRLMEANKAGGKIVVLT